MKRENGITLVVLVITIIILLILAGISIATLSGENGLFSRAKQARQNTLDAQSAENQILIGYEDAINKVVDGTREENNQLSIYPDYEKKQEITFDSNKSYTVQNDGYIQIEFRYTKGLTSGDVNDSMTINNIVVFQNNQNNTWSNFYTPLFLVKKGDVITYSNTSQTVIGYYYPVR